ncbi:MAG: hypothetical protein CW338_03945 [Clostridiales bacterium]|nr:hypothetical protein [Clostridiales bacterium]
MKKFFALLLAAVMLLSAAAFAEEDEVIEVTDYVATELGEEDILSFTILMDALPEGYEMVTYPVDGALYAGFMCEGNPVEYLVSVAHDELLDNYTLVIADLSVEAYTNAIAYLGVADEFVNPEFSFTKTSHGTDVIIVNENGASTDSVELISVYEGYVITMIVMKYEGEVTQEDVDIALQLLSDMWFVPAE